ncbi:MAG: hypothetical protein ABF296_12995 [Oceanococcaceae bacterium]
MNFPDWADVIGPVAYEQLVSALPGAAYDVPWDIDTPRGERLAGLIGDYAARRLIQHAAGTQIYIRLSIDPEDERHLRAIHAMRRGGLTPQQIAATYVFPTRLTERHIRRLLNKAATHLGELELESDGHRSG